MTQDNNKPKTDQELREEYREKIRGMRRDGRIISMLCNDGKIYHCLTIKGMQHAEGGKQRKKSYYYWRMPDRFIDDADLFARWAWHARAAERQGVTAKPKAGRADED